MTEPISRDIADLREWLVRGTKWLWGTLISAAAIVTAIFIAILQ